MSREGVTLDEGRRMIKERAEEALRRALDCGCWDDMKWAAGIVDAIDDSKGWISVDDRLPEQGTGEVFVLDDDGEPYVLCFSPHHGWCELGDADYPVRNVAYWRLAKGPS